MVPQQSSQKDWDKVRFTKNHFQHTLKNSLLYTAQFDYAVSLFYSSLTKKEKKEQ